MPSKPIFVSHATADKELADKLVLLIETGIGIPDKDVFCTSLEGLGIPSGANFVDFIRGQIQEPKAVIILLTPHYYASEFCLCELGASWSMAHRAFPLLLPPLTYDDVNGVLLGTQVLLLNAKEKLNEFQAEIIGHFDVKGKPFAIWEKRRDEFLDWIEHYIRDYQLPEKVDPAKHAALLQNYEEAKEALSDSEERIITLEGQIEEISKLKDKSEVDAILEKDIEDIEKFESLVDSANQAMCDLPNEVNRALFHRFRGEELEWPAMGYTDTDDRLREIKDALEQEFLVEGDAGLELNDEDPMIQSALTALEKLRSFVDDPSEEFGEYYANNYDHQLSFTNKRFWAQHL